jgi:hypothetical protein
MGHLMGLCLVLDHRGHGRGKPIYQMQLVMVVAVLVLTALHQVPALVES